MFIEEILVDGGVIRRWVWVEDEDPKHVISYDLH